MPLQTTDTANEPAYSPPTILGSTYGYYAVTRIPPATARVLNAHAALVEDPEADLSVLDEPTSRAVQEARQIMELVQGEALAYWHGMLDARCGTKDAQAPEERGGILEIQYLRGFIDGHLGAHAPKYNFHARGPSRCPQRMEIDNVATVEKAVREQVTALRTGDDDNLSVHSAGTDIPMPDTPFLNMAALVGYDERDGSPTSFQRYVMDEASYPGQLPPVDERRVTLTLEDDDDMYAYEPPAQDPLTPRDFRAVPAGIAPRPPRHLYPIPGPFVARAIPEIPLPEGVDRDTIAEDWDAAQRAALFEYDGEVAWMASEDKENPASAHQLAEAFIALAATVFPGESPPRPVMPFANALGKRPSSIAIIGTKEQLDHLTTSGTWATSWVCAQFFPNKPRPLRFVCTFGGLRLRIHEHVKAKRMIRTAIEESEEIAELAKEHGLDVTTSLDSMEVQHMQDADDFEQNDLWNVVMTPPTGDPAIQTAWRLTVASLHPRDPLRGELYAYPRPFKCKTCGCLTHPRRLCPTATAPGWTGTIPRWCVRKALWGRRDASGSSVKVRGAFGELLREHDATPRKRSKLVAAKTHKFPLNKARGILNTKRRARFG